MADETKKTEEKSFWGGMKKVLKKPAYWGGVVKATAIPLLEGGVKESDAKWDDSVVEIAKKFLEKLFPADKPSA
jgi:hypothetical protein